MNDMKQEHSHGHSHHHTHGEGLGGLHGWISPIVSFVMLAAGMVSGWISPDFLHDREWIRLTWYVIAFLPVGLPVLKEAAEGIARGDLFNEFTLMSIACVGAFCIGEFPEAVGVMLFYSVGEKLQDGAVAKATGDITRLLDVRPKKAHLVTDGKRTDVEPEKIVPGQVIEVLPGERVPLDGVVESAGGGSFDTAALTGESIPRDIRRGSEVLAGMISMEKGVLVKVTRPYSDSALARILEMVKDAQGRKARTELFIRRFARIYTPCVIALAALMVAVPALVAAFDSGFTFRFSEWLYRSLVFLVISCPCALVISVPLGYYAGIGASSKKGILFKGGNYLDAIAKVNAVAFDKTGTLTTGKFAVTETVSSGMDKATLLRFLASAESGSSHPLARTLVEYARRHGVEPEHPENLSEKPGFGAMATVDGKDVLAGNLRLLEEKGVSYPKGLGSKVSTLIVCAIDGKYAGYAALEDTVRPDSKDAVEDLHALGIDRIVMLSGDKQEIASEVGAKIGIKDVRGALLPQDKADFVENMERTPGAKVAFVGDGMNDAPVLAVSDVGIAMGGLGSDAAVESADVVIRTDMPTRVATAIKIGRRTRRIVMENIVGAIGVKVAVLVLGAFGIASLWAAVFADVGVALLAVLNSMRILMRK